MRILLTGGAGFIGSHTCVELLNAGYDAVIVDNLYNSSVRAVDRIRELTGRDVPFIQADCCDRQAMDEIFDRYDFDAVIHFAAYKAVGESVAKPLSYYRNNLDCTMTVCEAMKRHGVRRFIFSSSATVYGIPDHMPLDETMPTGCTNPYGWTKFMNERILTDLAAANPDWSVVLLRYFNPIGAHESGRIGEMPNGIPNNLMPYVMQVAAGKLPILHVFGDDYPTKDGTGVRDYIHVVDLAKGHVAAAAYAELHAGTEVINLGTGTGYSVLEIVQAFERVNGVKVPYRIESRRAGDIAECWADPGKAMKLLGWRAEKSLDDMCRDAWRWQKNNPNGYDD